MESVYIQGIVKGIGDWLKENKYTISTAESCTGGGIASSLTSISGASKYFRGGLVAYQNIIKTDVLGVNENTITKYDVVSENVVREMVKCSCDLFNSDYAIATTGYAGTSENENIPSGTIWIGVGSKGNIITMHLYEENTRKENIDNAITKALTLFFSEIVNKQKMR